MLDFSYLTSIHSTDQNHKNELHTAATSLQNLLYTAAEKSIPKHRFSAKSKPWWSENLNKLRKNLAHERRSWKRNYNSNSQHMKYLQARNQYFQEIKTAKQTCWNDFLENADSETVFKAYKYCKQRKLEKTPIICYNNQKATSFNDKSKLFLNALLPANSENTDDSIDSAYFAVNSTNLTDFCSAEYISDEDKWNWPELTKDELEHAIFSSSTKKAAGPDKTGFLIIHKAYHTIPDLFYQLYSKLIELGFHPDCWKEEIGVILKKLNKDDYSSPKSYRLVSLLNCLGKIAEKIVAERLAFYAESTDLLHNDQIGARKNRSAVDAAISLLSDIELSKCKKKQPSVLLMDVKGAFPNMNRAQLLKTCCELKFPKACISWIHSFCYSRLMKLAFDGEIMENPSTIYTGVPQGSSVSPILFLIYISKLFKAHSNLSVRMPNYMDDIAIFASSKSVHENCQILQNAAEKLIDWGRNHHVEFDMNKTELIHFNHAEKSLNESVKIKQHIIKPKEAVKWLGI